MIVLQHRPRPPAVLTICYTTAAFFVSFETFQKAKTRLRLYINDRISSRLANGEKCCKVVGGSDPISGSIGKFSTLKLCREAKRTRSSAVETHLQPSSPHICHLVLG